MNYEKNTQFESDVLLKSICENLNYNEFTNEEGITKIDLKEHCGHGSIEHIAFKNKLNIINFDLYLNNDLSITIPSGKKKLLYFFYTLEGMAYHSFDDSEKFKKIDELKTVAVGSSSYSHNKIIIKKGMQFKCNMIVISKDAYKKYFNSTFQSKSDQLNELYTIFTLLHDYIFECNHDLAIAKQLRHIKNIALTESISSHLELQSRYQLILASHVEKLYDETYNERECIGVSRASIQKIKTISDHIIDNPGLNHSQEKLCAQFFISQSKLQAGFKGVHKTTVSNFTRNVRLDKAEELLLNSDLNISEIVYTVGFTSRSYFSKIFKLRFGCNPTDYKKAHKPKVQQLV